MIGTARTSSRCWRRDAGGSGPARPLQASSHGAGPLRPGFTLIEVMAALAILGSLLVAAVMAKSRLHRQWSTAEARLRCVAAADELLATWWQDLERFPRSAAGPVPTDPQLSWRTRVLDDEPIEGLRCQIVRLEILDPRANPQTSPALALDVLLPKPADHGVDDANEEPPETPPG